MSAVAGIRSGALPTTWIDKASAYVALTKPRIIELLLITTVPAMIVAQHGLPPIWLIIATVFGGALSAGGANAINMYFDRDIDAVMRRTARRPLVVGSIAPRHALVFAIALEAVAVAELATLVNLLSALLALGAAAFYVLVYTLWLKRSSPQNIVIGGAAGSAPALIGWAAVSGRIELTPLVMFAIIFLWTPPHFWALAFKYREDYRSANVPMLPVVASLETTTQQILLYTIALWALTLFLVPVARLGVIYTVTATVGGAMFTAMALKLRRDRSEATAMKVFHFSITYLTVLFVALAIDQFIHIA